MTGERRRQQRTRDDNKAEKEMGPSRTIRLPNDGSELLWPPVTSSSRAKTHGRFPCPPVTVPVALSLRHRHPQVRGQFGGFHRPPTGPWELPRIFKFVDRHGHSATPSRASEGSDGSQDGNGSSPDPFIRCRCQRSICHIGLSLPGCGFGRLQNPHKCRECGPLIRWVREIMGPVRWPQVVRVG